VKGMKYVHQMNMFHRGFLNLKRQITLISFSSSDIKPENILMLNDKEAVISDFGSAIRYVPGESEETTAVGSPAFQPPCTNASGKVPSGFKLDIWALGVTLYEIKFGFIKIILGI